MNIPPRNEELEESVLGSLLMNWECVPVCMPILSEECFYNKNRPIFQAIKEDYEEHGDVDYMRVEHLLKKGNDEYSIAKLPDLTRDYALIHKTEEYSYLLADLADVRDIQRGLTDELSHVNERTARELITNVNKVLNRNMSGQGVPGLTYSQIMERDENKTTAEQLYTGDKFMDHTFFAESGCRRGEILIPFGDTGHGKTWFAVWLSARFLEQGYRGVFCVRESKDLKIAERVLSSMDDPSNIDNLIIADTQQGINNLDDIVATVKYHNAVKPIDFFVADHLRIIPVKGIDDWDEKNKITASVNRLMYLSQEVDALAIALSQVNRETQRNARGWQKDPGLGNVYGSSAIEQAATVAISIFRPNEIEELKEYYPNGDIRAVRGPNYNNDQSDTYDVHSVFIKQKKKREGPKYPDYVRFVHKDNGLQRSIPKAPF